MISQHTTTNMGSGHFAEEGYQKAFYFRNLEILNEYGFWKQIQGGYAYTTKASCYNVKSGYDIAWKNYFYFGGPGRNQNCL